MSRSLPEILRRFRPVTAPGPAGPPGMPVDRVTEMAAELAPVFAAVADTVVGAQAILDQARRDADSRRRAGDVEAQRILAEARASVDAVRAEAASSGIAALDATRDRLEHEAVAEAARVRAAGRSRIPAVVDAVVARMRDDLGLDVEARGVAEREVSG